MPKVIWTSTRDDSGECPGKDERVVFEGSTEKCNEEVKRLKGFCTDDGPDWYIVVSDNYKLKEFNP